MADTKMPNEDLLQLVANGEFGGDIDGMLAHFATDSIVPGICPTCHGIEYSCEPDMEDGMCEECETPTVKSILILAEVI